MSEGKISECVIVGDRGDQKIEYIDDNNKGNTRNDDANDLLAFDALDEADDTQNQSGNAEANTQNRDNHNHSADG